MSVQVTTAMVKQFSSNVLHLSQQKGSRLAGLVRKETQHAEEAFYDRVGSVTAQLKVGRHSDVTYQDTPHSRRRCITNDYFHADLVDVEDKLRIIMNPESEYAIEARNAHGRAMDDVIITAALGPASTGKDGSGTANLANANKVACYDGSTTTGVKLNVETLRAVKKKFNANEVEPGDMYICMSAEQFDALLGQTETTSSDYNTVKTLVQGDIDTFMGFKFIHSERLNVTSAATTYDETSGAVGSGSGSLAAGARRAIAWKKDGILLAVPREITGRIDELPQKHYAKQVYSSMSLGAVRMEEVKVVELLCAE